MRRPLLFAIAIAVLAAFATALWGARAFTTSSAEGEATVLPVQKVQTEQILGWIGQGKRVVFVDARESEEFDEEHIPGAVNVSLRNLERLDPKQYKDADLIVAYCLKDFRGYEVAKALKRAGFAQSVIMKEYGIGGWKKQGLPTVLGGASHEQAGRDRLATCARDPQGCINSARMNGHG
jgi:rhodanese-related sulfurtransferase